MYIIIFTVSLMIVLQAQSIEQLISQSIQKHPSLQIIEHRLSKMDERIAMSQNFSNPDISFIVNDIQFDDPSSRDLEPMQFEAISFKQKFPWFGKLEAKKSFTQSQKNVILNSYDAAKVQLALQIRTTAYTFKELEARIDILKRYKDVSKQNIELYTSYASTENKSHASSMSASLVHSKIKIRHQKYLAILKTQKARLKYLVQGNVTSISNTLTIKAPKPLQRYLNKLENNPNYNMRLSQNSVAVANKEIFDLDHTPDPYVQVGYFHRQAFPDYAAINVGFSLPIYGTEALNSEAARKEVLATTAATLDFKSSLTAEIETMYAKLTEAYMIVNIIENESLPQLAHMFELTQSSIQSGGNLFTYTSLLEQKLALEEENISIKAEYLRTQAKLKSLIGEI